MLRSHGFIVLFPLGPYRGPYGPHEPAHASRDPTPEPLVGLGRLAGFGLRLAGLPLRLSVGFRLAGWLALAFWWISVGFRLGSASAGFRLDLAFI